MRKATILVPIYSILNKYPCSFIFFNPLKIRKNKIKSDKINKILYCTQNLGHKIGGAVHHSPLLFFQ